MASDSVLDSLHAKALMQHFRKQITETMSAHTLGAFESPKETPDAVYENILIDDEFIDAMKPNIIKQFTPEQIELLRGKTAKRITVTHSGSEITFSMEF